MRFNPYLPSKKLENVGQKLLACVRKLPVSNRVQFPEIFPIFFPALLNAIITFRLSYTFYS